MKWFKKNKREEEDVFIKELNILKENKLKELENENAKEISDEFLIESYWGVLLYIELLLLEAKKGNYLF